jgi:hypothetical protein
VISGRVMRLLSTARDATAPADPPGLARNFEFGRH